MSANQQVAVRRLRWTLGVVVLWQSYRFGFVVVARDHLQRMALPEWVVPALGGAEIVAAILFLVPKLSRIGGYALLAVFAAAATLHVLHGQFEIGSLFVYAAAALTCIAENNRVVSGLAS